MGQRTSNYLYFTWPSVTVSFTADRAALGLTRAPLPVYLQEQYPTALEEPLEVQFVESSEECMDKESTTLSLANLENVDGKVVVYRMCSKAASRSEYYLDYFFKAFRLEEQGAVMVIPVEAWDSKLPEHMDRGELTVRFCVAFRPTSQSRQHVYPGPWHATHGEAAFKDLVVLLSEFSTDLIVSARYACVSAGVCLTHPAPSGVLVCAGDAQHPGVHHGEANGRSSVARAGGRSQHPG